MPAADQVQPRRPQLAARLGWPACGLTLALLIAGLLLSANTPAGVVGLAPVALWAAANALVGALIVARRPEHPIGWLLAASGLLVSIAQFAGQYAYYTLVTRPGSLPWGQAMLWLAGWPSSAGFILVLFWLLLFPTGRLLSPRWRPVARFAAAVYLAHVVGYAFAPGPLDPQWFGSLPNPLGIESLTGVTPMTQAVVTGLGAVVALAAVASLLLRLRRAQGVERLQLKWFCYAAAVFATALCVVVAFRVAAPLDGLVIMPALLALPIAIGIAVLRYRLYDIDRLINRTLVYGLLTVLLGLSYAACVVVLGQLFGQDRSSLAVAGATLAAAALFQPARRRIQHVVDRRFNRRRYDAARTVEAFSARLRDQLDLDTLSSELLAVVDQTVQPAKASLWLRPSTRVSLGGERQPS